MTKKKRVEKKKKTRRKRKNFLPTLIVMVLLWIALFLEVYFVDPTTFGALPLFFALLFTALLFTFSTILLNTRRGFLISAAITLFLVLRYFGVGNIINALLLSGVFIAIEVYFSKGNS